MKDNIAFPIRFILVLFSLSLIQIGAFSQEKYLVVLDIQDFPKKDKQLERSVREMIVNVNTILNHFDAEKVIYIKAAGRALNITSRGFSTVALPAPGFDSALVVVNNNTFIKTRGDAFTSAEFIRFLEDKKVKEIILVGLMAEECIYDTALGGKGRGYDITIVPEGIVGMTPKKKEKAILKLKDKGIKFIPISGVISAL